MKRRDFLLAMSGGTLAAGLPWPLLAGQEKGQTITLTAAKGEANITGIDGLMTRVWQYNGMTPGPVVRVRQGEPVTIPFTNKLGQPTTIHWHGMRIANAMDGVPGLTQEAVQPGEQFVYRFTPQDAGTYWYHTHNRTWEQMARGLQGVLIVEEREPPPVDQDLVMVVDDWLLDDAGQVDEKSLGNLHDWAHGGRMGNTLSVNGRVNPKIPVKSGERLRLRVINIANSRIMPLALNGEKATVIAIDGQPVDPVPLEGTFTLAPAQRMELIVDLAQSPGSELHLEYVARNQRITAATLIYHAEDRAREMILQSVVHLPPNPLPEVADLASAKRISLPIEGGAMGRMQGATYKGKWLDINQLIDNNKIWALGGVADLPEQPLFQVKRGERVVVEMDNQNRWPHAMHVHGHHFRPLDGEGKVHAPWRDTLLLNGGDKSRIAFVADNPGKWLIHCHMIEHTAGGMITWFEVI